MRLAIQAGSVADGTLEGCIAYCKAMDVGNVILTAAAVPGYRDTGLIDPKALKAQVAAVEKAGLDTGAMQFWPPFSLADEAATAATMSKLGKNMDAAAKAGLDTLAMFVSLAKPVDPADEEGQWNTYIGFYQELLSQADQHGIKIATHFSGHRGRSVLAGSEGYRRLFEAVPSPNNGLCFCTGNVWNSDGERIYNLIREFAPRIFTVHMRSTKISWGESPYWWDIPDGPDIRKIMQTLKEVGYTGVISSEHMPDMPDQNRQDITAAWAMGYMKAIMRYL
jgi:sugar phosphate isomerase/epimerase